MVGCSATDDDVVGKWVAVGSDGVVYTSSDLTTWSEVDSGTPRDLHDVTAGGGTLLAVGHGALVASDDAGATWRNVIDAETEDIFFEMAAYDGQSLVAAGNYISAAPPPNNVSPRIFRREGDAWTALDGPGGDGTSLTALDAGADGLLCGYRLDEPEPSHGIGVFRPDGEEWESEFFSDTHSVFAVSLGWPMVGVGGCRVVDNATDTWQTAHETSSCSHPTTASLARDDAGGVLAITGQTAISFDGQFWLESYLPPGRWVDVHHHGGIYAIVGRDAEDRGLVATSHDGGLTWSAPVVLSLPLRGVTHP